MSEVALGTQNANAARSNRGAVSRRVQPSGWYGVWAVVVTEGSLFAYLLFSYYYCLLQASGKWPPNGPPSLALPIIATIILVASSAILLWAQHSIRQSETKRLTLGLALAFILGAIFVVTQSYDWLHKSVLISADNYHSFYVLVTGLDIAHAIVGLIILAALAGWSLAGRFDGERNAAISIGVIYWNFTVVVWLLVFASFYLLPFVR